MQKMQTHSIDLVEIENIEIIDEGFEEVYDISVENYETFVGGIIPSEAGYKGVLVHNSAMYPSIGQTFNLSPNTYILKIDCDTKTLARWIYENYISDEDANRIVQITYKPMTWFGEEGILGKRQTDKLINVLSWVKDNNYILTVAGAVLNNHKQKLGFHTELIIELRDQRDFYRALEKKAAIAKNDVEYKKYNNAQTARKLVLNGGYYGSQGTDSFNFYSLGLAESITKSAKVEISFVCYFLEDYIIKSEDKSRTMALENQGEFHDIIDDDEL